jgi:hypothetical protein
MKVRGIFGNGGNKNEKTAVIHIPVRSAGIGPPARYFSAGKCIGRQLE